VDDKVHIIHEYPFAFLVALDVARLGSGFRKLQIDFVGDSLELPWVGAATDDEVIGKPARFRSKLQNGDVLRLLGFTCIDRS